MGRPGKSVSLLTRLAPPRFLCGSVMMLQSSTTMCPSSNRWLSTTTPPSVLPLPMPSAPQDKRLSVLKLSMKSALILLSLSALDVKLEFQEPVAWSSVFPTRHMITDSSVLFRYKKFVYYNESEILPVLVIKFCKNVNLVINKCFKIK